MKNKVKIILVFLIPFFLFSSCKKDPIKSESTILTEYMASNDLDLNNILDGWITAGPKINIDTSDYSVADFYVIDLRGAADYEAGHIKDAHNTTLGNIIDEAEKANGKKILVICYTGQTAARGTSALRMLGYNAACLKWGMAGWHEDFAGKWDSNAKDLNHENWVTTGEPKALSDYDLPKINTGKNDGREILKAQVQKMLTNTSWTITNDVVLPSPGDYFVNNKWSQDSWDAYGHIKDINRIDEDLLLGGIKHLDASKTIVTYCYTGQTSAITNGWLEVLGYNCKSLLFGANGIVYTTVKDGKPTKSWKGAGSASENNFGYYNNNGDYFPPK